MWDIGGISLMEDVHGDTMFAVSRRPKPAQSMPDSDKSDWDKLASRQFPYDATPIVDDGTTTIHSLFSGDAAADEAKPAVADSVISAVSYVAEGEQGEDRMSSSLGTFMKGVSVLEH